MIYYLDFELDPFLEVTLQVISYSFFLGISLSKVTLAPDPDKRETSVVILDSENISVSADGLNWLIKFDVLVTFFVLIDSLGIFSFTEIGATKLFFSSYLKSIIDSEFLVYFSSS